MQVKAEELDVLIVGAGFAGLYAVHKFRSMGLKVQAVEAGTDVGGTWYWNRYPGARCDVESLSYSFSFSEVLQQDWRWRYRYATQPEILDYANHVADLFDLRRDITFETRMTEARWDAAACRWKIDFDKGAPVRARFLVMATGCLSVPNTPDLPGFETFEGEVYHTGYWPHEGVKVAGKRVGIIGTGSSAIQAVPFLAAEAAQLTVFQRTPNFSIPAWNAPMASDKEIRVKAQYKELREVSRHSYSGDFAEEAVVSILELTSAAREAEFERRWADGGFNFQYPFTDLMSDPRANQLAVEFVHRKIRSIVRDPETADALCPKSHPLGSKRLCVDSDFYETFNRDNVRLVDLATAPIRRITPKGLETETGRYEFDTLVLATGFDAMTGALMQPEIVGTAGRTLRETWAEGPVNYLGISVAGFPNLFTITGPGSPSVLANMITAIEQHVDLTAGIIDEATARKAQAVEVEPSAQSAWVQRVNEGAKKSLYSHGASWYLGSNIPGKPRVFMPFVEGFGIYCDLCDDMAGRGYQGFHFA